jgi:glycosyltransferase involved in cell wall biosynthesis
VDISIFIPVYKESNQLASMLNELSSQNVTKEIFVTVDESTLQNLAVFNHFQKLTWTS